MDHTTIDTIKRHACAVLLCMATCSLSHAGAQSIRAMDPGVAKLLGIAPLQQQLTALEQQSQGESAAAVSLRERIVERILRASFEVDSVTGRIDTEASYASEDRYLLQVKSQRETTMLNLATFAVSGALGAAGGAMQLTRDFNHAGTALSAASGGSALVFSAVQLKGISGGKVGVRSPYNMLAQVLGRESNPESRYPTLIAAYLEAPSGEKQRPLAGGLIDAWRRLHRLQTDGKGDGSSIESVTADRGSGRKESADELADREAMLHDLHASLINLKADLQAVLLSMDEGLTNANPGDH